MPKNVCNSGVTLLVLVTLVFLEASALHPRHTNVLPSHNREHPGPSLPLTKSTRKRISIVDVSGAIIRQEQFHNPTCSGAPYNTTTVAAGTCRNGTTFSCSTNHQCIVMRLYSSMDCSGALTSQTGQVCDICYGSNNSFIKYTGCGTSTFHLHSCKDSSCNNCISVPTSAGCNYGMEWSSASCGALSIHSYDNAACAGRVNLYSTVPANMCDADIYWKCD